MGRAGSPLGLNLRLPTTWERALPPIAAWHSSTPAELIRPLDAYRRVRYADCGMPNPFVLKRERQYFEVIYEDLAPNQRNLIRALAAEPARSITSRDFLDRAGLRADSSSQRALSALEGTEKVELGPDGWQVSDPLFALWLAQGTQAAALPVPIVVRGVRRSSPEEVGRGRRGSR